MNNNMMELIVDLNSVSDTCPLQDDHEKMADVISLCKNLEMTLDLTTFVQEIENLEVLDSGAIPWKVIKDLSSFHINR